MFQHRNALGQPLALPVGKVVCVGRNYAEHARELNNPVPSEPLLFMKPASALVALDTPIQLPQGQGAVHYETELALLIGQPLVRAEPESCVAAIHSLGLALDLTLREVQDKLKAQGHPWEKAKGFDGACPISHWVAYQGEELHGLQLSLHINGELRQQGCSAQMLTAIPALLSYISHWFSLQPGDVILTGTPAGVGVLEPGDRLTLELEGLLVAEAQVAESTL
ncbi:fumarylacetoacetate hydrolase family protein [Nitrincola tapanii]|uniref:Fumarylacetoacetate hydrolase family protein n=1 Tax=Nitrincola tapanii TaxID=1708751 RepID=A0A5A9W8A3_9GAMM|nr:fumarylacetoacetate hydrolase family protein [Nitrincola tapanii]KAA0876385.1 fumarylacetoacetate hydrolase family protein [Nitrincola tapanii]